MNYKIKMKKSDFFKLHSKIAVKNLEIKDDYARFEVELGSYNIIKDSEYKYMLYDSFRINFVSFIKTYYLLLIGISFLFSILYINSYRINSIIFSEETPINSKIEEKIKMSYKKLFFHNFSTIDCNKLSKELRGKYCEYPYINIVNKNNNIYVEIKRKGDEEYIFKDFTGKNIIAKKDGIIEKCLVYSGKSDIKKNQYVKKDDILINGNLNNSSVSPCGLVLAYTYEKVTINIDKIIENDILTKNKQMFNRLCLFNEFFNLGRKYNYNVYEENINVIFNFYDIFSIQRIEEVEKNVIIKENTEDDAIEYAKNKVISDFEGSKTIDEEKIVDTALYEIETHNDYYSVSLILKKLESIGILQ